MRSPRSLLALLTPAVLMLGAAGALALPQQQGSVDLVNQADGQWQGPGEGAGSSAAGASVAPLPAIFGRSRGAVAIGAPEANPAGRQSAGSVYVVPGQTSPGTIDLTASAGRGYRIDGAAPGDELGFSLVSLTLANGDPGLAVGAPYAGPPTRSQAGAVYVIDLHRLHHDLDLAAASHDRALVSVISGARTCAQSGFALADGGVIGRGRGDALLVGAPGFDPAGCPRNGPSGVSGGNRGAAYVVFGRRLAGRLDLASGGARISEFVGAASGDRAGAAVAGAGVPGSFMIGAPQASPAGRAGAGEVFLLHHASPRGVASLGAPPLGSSLIEGPAADDATGTALATTRGYGAGQRASAVDLVIGAPQGTPRGRLHAGSILILPEGSNGRVVDLKRIQSSGSRGGQIDGPDTGDQAGSSLAAVGDVNGDGRGDIAIGIPYLNSPTGQDRIDNGGAYVLYGGRGAVNLDLARLGSSRGYIVRGARDNDQAGTAVAGGTDLNGDGRPDVLVGAPFAVNTSGPQPSEGGAVFTLWGFGVPSLRLPQGTVTAVARRTFSLVPTVSRTGVAGFSITPALAPGLHLDPRTGRIGGRPTRRGAARTYTLTMNDFAGTASARLRLRVAAR